MADKTGSCNNLSIFRLIASFQVDSRLVHEDARTRTQPTRPTPSSAEYPIWPAITGSGNNVAICYIWILSSFQIQNRLLYKVIHMGSYRIRVSDSNSYR